MTAIAGVAVISFSSLPLLRNFGIFVALNVAVALLAALVVLPPLLVWADKRELGLQGHARPRGRALHRGAPLGGRGRGHSPRRWRPRARSRPLSAGPAWLRPSRAAARPAGSSTGACRCGPGRRRPGPSAPDSFAAVPQGTVAALTPRQHGGGGRNRRWTSATRSGRSPVTTTSVCRRRELAPPQQVARTPSAWRHEPAEGRRTGGRARPNGYPPWGPRGPAASPPPCGSPTAWRCPSVLAAGARSPRRPRRW